MNKNLTIIVLSIAVIILLLFLFTEGKSHDSHKDEHAHVIAERDSFKISEAKALQVISEKDSTIVHQDIVIKDLTIERDSYRKQLDKSTNQAQRLALEVRELKSHDTSEYSRKVDSLINEVINLTFLYNQYRQYADSITVVIEEQKQQYESRDVERQRLYAELRRNYDNVSRQYDNLFKGYQGARKDIKRERLKTKISAVLGLIGIGLIKYFN